PGLDEPDFVLTDRSLGEEHLAGRWEALGRRPLPFETSYPGLFAAGDVRAGSTKRVAAAVGEGSAAVRSVHEYLALAHWWVTYACRSFVEEISTCLRLFTSLSAIFVLSGCGLCTSLLPQISLLIGSA